MMTAKKLQDLDIDEEKTRIEKLELLHDLSFGATQTNQVKIEEQKEFNEFKTQKPDLKVVENSSSDLAAIEKRLSKLEALLDYKVEAVSEAKLLDQKVTQVLQQIIKTQPALKPQAMMVKKLVASYLKKIS